MKTPNIALLAVLVLGLALQSPGQDSRKWSAAVYDHLVVGESSRNAVLKQLGKPDWVGQEADTGLPVMHFTVSDPVPGTLVVHTRHGILGGLALYPKKELTKADIVHMFGSHNLMTRYSSDDCLTEGGSAPIYEDPKGSLEQLEYRSRGIAVAVHGDEVEVIEFVGKPFYPTRSHCKGRKLEKSAGSLE